jgi:hypothetical protein
MEHIISTSSMILVVTFSALSASAQKNVSLADNAALRYWTAFSAVQDSAITDQQARELNAILDGTAPYDDSKYRDLIEKNMLALEIMDRATSLSNCDWGLDYGSEDVPVEYAREALALGRDGILTAVEGCAAIHGHSTPPPAGWLAAIHRGSLSGPRDLGSP